MSGPKTLTLPSKSKKSKVAEVEQQPSSPPALGCDEIRERAYYKWKAAGCPCGDGVEFWLEAEAELLAESQSNN